MTPTAARGLLESIFWKPQMFWEIVAIDVLRPIQYRQMTTNGVNRHQKPARGKTLGPFSVDDPKNRVQCSSLELTDVAYNIHAWARLVPGASERPGPQENTVAYHEQFMRRVRNGKFFRGPYLGRRENLAMFSEIDETPPLDVDIEVGTMPLRFRFLDVVSAKGKPTGKQHVEIDYFDAHVNHGRMLVPASTDGAQS